MYPPSTRQRQATIVPELDLPADRGDLFALTRALVFTKEAYRTLRRPRPAAPAPTEPIRVDIKPIVALTPWDLMDDEASEGGIAFTFFQRRSERPASQAA